MNRTPLHKLLVEFSSKRKRTNRIVGDEVKPSLKFTSLLDLLPRTSRPALIGADTHSLHISHSSDGAVHTRPLSHFRLVDFISNEYDLKKFGLLTADRVAICLPQGPELVVCLLATLTYCTCIPINPSSTEEEIKFELKSSAAKAVIFMGVADSEHIRHAALELDIILIVLKPKSSKLASSNEGGVVGRECGLFSLHQDPSALVIRKNSLRTLMRAHSTTNIERQRALQNMVSSPPGSPSLGKRRAHKMSSSSSQLINSAGNSLSRSTSQAHSSRLHPLRPRDVALVLHTSGTSGTKKVVPILLEDLCVGAFCVAVSMELSEKDICCNMMPLFHVGGIVRNIFAPLFAGGSLICMPGVDPVLFWELCRVKFCTWYYAAPTIHMMIIEEAKRSSARSPPPIPKLKTSYQSTQTPYLPGSTNNPHCIRLIANAAGGLLPSVATELKRVFGEATVILPSYGMTECMPITCPPSNYQLDRPGTSGLPVGPEVAIRGSGGCDEEGEGNGAEFLPPNKIGNIVVRGAPVMHGYENNPAANKDAFSVDGWFDTGDMGYMDADGFLYITGRSKEVINRGGEIISPFDIEDVIVMHPSVKAAAAFSVPHDKLQETIGVAIVPNPGVPRLSIKSLHKFLSDKLQPAKWPHLIVFMDDLVKTVTNKVQRVGLATRMNLKEISDQTPEWERLLEAVCPPKGSSLKVPIPTSFVTVDFTEIINAARKSAAVQDCVVRYYNNKIVVYSIPAYVEVVSNELAAKQFIEKLNTYFHTCLHDYLVPAAIVLAKNFPMVPDRSGAMVVDMDALPLPNFQQDIVLPNSRTEEIVQEIFSQCLLQGSREGANSANVSITDDFFESGGDSMKAGQLVAQLRKTFDVNLPSTCIFVYRTVEKIASHIDDLLASRNEKISKSASSDSLSSGDANNTYFAEDEWLLTSTRDEFSVRPSQTSAKNLFGQILPLLVGYPLRRVCSWFLFLCWFAYFNSIMDSSTPSERLVSLVLSLAATKCIMMTVLPLAFIPIKWVIIGKYKAGRHLLWGDEYLRWWTVEQCRKLCGRGIFKYFSWSMNIYYRWLGAKIGDNVAIAKYTTIAEYDLMDIGDGSVIESKCLLRPFTADGKTMLLKEIKIGKNCHLHTKVSIAPGAKVVSGIVMPPMSSSYELRQLEKVKNQKKLSSYSSVLAPPLPLILFFGYPVLFLVKVISLLPVLGILSAMAHAAWHLDKVDSWVSVVEWFLVPERIAVYLALRPVYKIVVPVIRLACCIGVKWIFVGKFYDKENVTSPRTRYKYWMMDKMFGDSNFYGIPGIIGTHYEGVSWIYRLLGAKIGKRIYWPGSGIDVIEFDLLTVGDDVVFGSRSVIRCSNGQQMRRVRLLNGCNIADRCYISPGVTVGPGAVLGSGTLAPENFYFAPKSVWVGSGAGEANCLNRGEEIPEGELPDNCGVEDIEEYYDNKEREPLPPSPFGQAFYMGKAPYFVIPIPLITLFNILWQSFVSSYFAFPIVASLLIVSAVFPNGSWSANRVIFFISILVTYCVVMFFTTMIALAIDIVSKWILLGRRTPGEYGWNVNSYCQRWQLYLLAQRITHSGYFGNGLLEFILGSAYLVWYFRALGCNIGENVCLYPTGGDPMMTEPDLVTIGDNVSINNASVVGHINSRGKFRLNNIFIGPECSLRSYSRLLSGANMEVGSKLLEHTLIMGGDNISPYSVWQGWPASFLYNLPVLSPTNTDNIFISIEQPLSQVSNNSSNTTTTDSVIYDNFVNSSDNIIANTRYTTKSNNTTNNNKHENTETTPYYKTKTIIQSSPAQL